MRYPQFIFYHIETLYRPDALTTLPNQLVLKLQQITKSWTQSEDLDLSEVEKMLMNAAVVRPLHSELAIEVCSDLLNKLTTSGAGKDEEDQRKHLRVLCLAARVLGSLVCPSYLTGSFLKQV